MLSTTAYFKTTASDELMRSVVEQCDKILCSDFGMQLHLGYLPDLLMVARNGREEIVGLIIIHFAESTCAWEIGTMSVLKKYCRNDVLEVMVNGACDAIRVLQKHRGLSKSEWMVRRVRSCDVKQKELFIRFGFSSPNSWMDNVLSDSGYIPFDPFDTVLMKMEIGQA
jgi:hypothetical protein